MWKERVEGIVAYANSTFFSDNSGIVQEVACEFLTRGCNADAQSFKGYLLRWMANVAELAPYTRPTILPLLRKNAEAAVKSCSGGDTGTACGFSWLNGTYDGKTAASEQMNALAAISVMLLDDNVTAAVTSNTGGTSRGNPGAGTDQITDIRFIPITTADKAGAAILTLITLVGLISTTWWMLV
jgi:mannan endo-1,6-alpha-mannosidase